MIIHLFNSKAPNAVRVPVTVNITQNDLVHTNDGEQVFLITLDVGILDINKKRIDTVVLNNVQKPNIKDEIKRGLTIIASKINWKNLEEDNRAPSIMEIYPTNNSMNVPIDSNVRVLLRDEFPMTGIDESSIKLYVNDIEVTSEIKTKIKDNEASITWNPKKILS